MSPTDYLTDLSTTDDALVLASVSSRAEFDLLNDWLRTQRAAHPGTRVEVLRLPHDDPPPQLVEQLVGELGADEGRAVIPVRVFWVPGGLPTRVKLAGLISGRDTYRPPQALQRAILRKDPSRARIVAGEPATVSELRQQWRDNTVGATPQDFAKFVLRRAALAVERIELRLLGPAYKSPRLITDELMASTRFINGMDAIPGASPEKAEEMLNELATGWSRFSVDLIPNLGRTIFSRGFDPRIDYDSNQIEAMRRGLEDHPAVFLWSHRSYLDGVIVPVALQENKLPPAHTFAGINLSFGFMGPLMRRSGVIFLRRKLDDPLYKYVLRQFVGYIVSKRFNLSWSIEGTVADRKDVAAQARSAVLRRGRLPGRPQRGHPAAADVDQFRPVARDRRVRRVRPRRGEDPRGRRMAVQLHQGTGRTQLRQDLRPLPGGGVDAAVPR